MKTIFHPRSHRLILTAIACLVIIAGFKPLRSQTPDKDYLVYVLSEAADKISLIRFGPAGAKVDRTFATGDMPTDIDGPHGIAIAPDKQTYYVSLAHGRPFGTVWKYSTKDDGVLGRVVLGYFPATMDINSDGSLLYVVNFNLHGDMVPSSVSIVATERMLEVARIKTCAMPHGSRLNSQGTKHYSACMMDDMLVEIDTNTLKVSRHFLLTKGREMGMKGAPTTMPASPGGTKHDMAGHGTEPPKPGDVSCSPTWAQPSPSGDSIFVACNKSDEIVEIDAGAWKLKRRIPSSPGVYNLAITKDGSRLIATNKRAAFISVFDVKL